MRTCDQYDRLRKRNAFLEQYKKESLGNDAMQEFDSSRYIYIDGREVVQNLVSEYIACESPDYLNWGSSSNQKEENAQPTASAATFDVSSRLDYGV